MLFFETDRKPGFSIVVWKPLYSYANYFRLLKSQEKKMVNFFVNKALIKSPVRYQYDS